MINYVIGREMRMDTYTDTAETKVIDTGLSSVLTVRIGVHE